MQILMRAIRTILGNRDGAAAAEYALVLAILGAALTFGALALGTEITQEVEQGAEASE